MAGRSSRPRSKRANAQPLAPVGPNVVVRLSGHAAERFFERFVARGVTKDHLVASIRVPNMKRRDEWDPDFPGERIRRWVRLVDGSGKLLTVRVVFIVGTGADDRNAIEVVTLILEHER